MLNIRFECVSEDRVSPPYGPFEYVQLTYNMLRVNPDGMEFAFIDSDGRWRLQGEGNGRDYWTDVVIEAA